MSLIDWDDPDDALRRIVVPDRRELEAWGCLDPSNESNYKITESLEHKYPAVALLLVSDMCGSFCRFCFRKRLFMNSNAEVSRDLDTEIEYIRRHREITNVLLSGGDPLMLSTPKLDEIIKQVHSIDHVQIIRIGTKIPVFDPFRILNDSALLETIDKYSSGTKKIYFMTHFNHPRELTDAAAEAMDLLRGAGAITANQTPLISGVNDDPEVLADLFNKLASHGIPSYYVFQCRPTLGNKAYAVTIERGFRIFEEARKYCSGLAHRARYVMSHSTGKIEITGMTRRYILFKYLRAADPDDLCKLIIRKRNPFAFWFDDFESSSNEDLHYQRLYFE